MEILATQSEILDYAKSDYANNVKNMYLYDTDKGDILVIGDGTKEEANKLLQDTFSGVQINSIVSENDNETNETKENNDEKSSNEKITNNIDQSSENVEKDSEIENQKFEKQEESFLNYLLNI